MGLPTFYVYPGVSAGMLEVVSLGEPLSDLQETPIRDAVDARALSGRAIRTVLGGRRRVRVIVENFTSQLVERGLTNMQAHLERGGFVGFSRDHAKTWGAFATTAPAMGDTVIRHNGNAWSTWSAAAALAQNDEVLIQSPNPEYAWEIQALLSAPTTTRLVTSGAVRYDYGQEPVLLRWRDFYPMLRLPEDGLGKPLVVHSHRVTYTLDVELEEDPAALHAMGATSAAALSGATKTDRGTSIEQLLAGFAGRGSGANAGAILGKK